MKYFDLFGIEPQFLPDKAALRKKYLELSRKFHPDYFVHSDSDAQVNAVQQTAEINKAYKTLTNEDSLIGYVLAQRGVLQPDEKYTLPPEFLMEMMELNEAAEEEDIEALKRQVEELQEELHTAIKPLLQKLDVAYSDKDELQAIKEYYFKKKYLQRLQQQMIEKL